MTSDWKGAVVGGIAAMIPDIDQPKSHIGKPFFFLSIPIYRVFGHRTLTHSLLFVMALGFILWSWLPHDIVLAVIAGIFAHIAGDMITGKVKILYPLPVSIGIRVPRIGYLLIDRMTKIVLSVMILWVVAERVLQYF